jgi:hypothetical protein
MNSFGEDESGIRHLFEGLETSPLDELELVNRQLDIEEREDVNAQLLVFNTLLGLYPDDGPNKLPSELEAAGVLFTTATNNDPYTETTNAAVALYNAMNAGAIPEEHIDLCERIAQTLLFVGEVAQVSRGYMPKSEIQTNILADSIVDIETKTALLKSLDILSNEDGIDITDIDGVGAALAAKEADDELEVVKKTIVRDVKERFTTETEQFLTENSIHPDDPMWGRLKSIAGHAVTSSRMTDTTLEFSIRVIGGRSLEEALDSLKITKEQYLQLIESIL